MSYDKQPGGYGPPGDYGPPAEAGTARPAGWVRPARRGRLRRAAPGGYDPYGYGYGAPPPRPNNGMAIATLVMGIAGLFVCGITSLVGIVLGHVSLGQIKKTGEEGRGMAIAGLVLSYFGVACWVIVLLIWLGILGVIFGTAATYSGSDPVRRLSGARVRPLGYRGRVTGRRGRRTRTGR
nr:hypothetical protein GCM10020093_115940 [Planobispora longispora]